MKSLTEGTASSLNAEILPDHTFFKTERWRSIGCGGSAYFGRSAGSFLRETPESCMLQVLCNLKNYDDEIGFFVKWLLPYIKAESGDVLGYEKYEQDEESTTIFMPKEQKPDICNDPTKDVVI